MQKQTCYVRQGYEWLPCGVIYRKALFSKVEELIQSGSVGEEEGKGV